MSERITRQNVEARVENLNRRMEAAGTVGTKREVADFLHAMMVGIDLSRQS